MCGGDGCDSGSGASSDGTPRDQRRHYSQSDLRETILKNNQKWAERMTAADPNFFKRLVNIQTPEWLWIGCSDSRVPANELIGLGPGEVFVQRNVGNLATHKDMNVMSCMEYAVTVLKVKHIIICGHYNCGAVKAALTLPCKTPGLVNLWIQDIRDTRDRNTESLQKLKGDAQVNRLVELNVMRQVFNVCTSPIVQNAWDQGQQLAVHGLVYSVEDGLLKELMEPITCLEDFEHSSSNVGDGPARLSRALVEFMSFERAALRRASLDKTNSFILSPTTHGTNGTST